MLTKTLIPLLTPPIVNTTNVMTSTTRCLNINTKLLPFISISLHFLNILMNLTPYCPSCNTTSALLAYLKLDSCMAENQFSTFRLQAILIFQHRQTPLLVESSCIFQTHLHSNLAQTLAHLFTHLNSWNLSLSKLLTQINPTYLLGLSTDIHVCH